MAKDTKKDDDEKRESRRSTTVYRDGKYSEIPEEDKSDLGFRWGPQQGGGGGASRTGVAINPGGRAGIGLNIGLGSGRRAAGVTANAMSPESAAQVASAAQSASDRLFPRTPAPRTAAAKAEAETKPAEPPAEPPTGGGDPWGDGSDHGGIYHVGPGGAGGHYVYYNDGYWRHYDNTGTVVREQNYGSPSNFPSDEDLKDVIEPTDENDDADADAVIDAILEWGDPDPEEESEASITPLHLIEAITRRY